jgi:hypothetical protein
MMHFEVLLEYNILQDEIESNFAHCTFGDIQKNP